MTRLIGRTGSGADVLARIPAERGEPGWRAALRRLRDNDGDLTVEAGPDGHYRWRFANGSALIAESPAGYRDELTAREAFTTARRTAAAELRAYELVLR
jgi:uncharacterized protein YegP (UPF0339 family)